MLVTDKDPFGQKAWQEFLNQIAWLEENNIRIEFVRDLLEEHKKKAMAEMQENQKLSDRALKCPECGTPLQLLPVNDSPATQTGDDSKSVWLCRKCFYEEFSDKTVKEQKRIRMKAETEG